jgi:hypothetical protein
LGEASDEFERAHRGHQGGGVLEGSSAAEDVTGRITALFGVHESRASFGSKRTTTGACGRLG